MARGATIYKKLNLGAGADWGKLKGWEVLDHNIISFPGLRPQAWELPYPDKTFEIVFCSHMFEHISHLKIEQVICEINRVMKNDGILRLLTPDLRKLATAYVNNDSKAMQNYIKDTGLKTPLGLGQAFMNFIVAIGVDNYLLSSDYSTIIAGYGHIYCYDYEMLSKLLKNYGFYKIRQCTIDDSEIDEHRKLRNSPYNLHADFSLIVECRKKEKVPFSYEQALLHTGNYSLRKLIPQQYSLLWFIFRVIGYSYNSFRFALSKIPACFKNRIKELLRKENGK